MPDRFCPLLQLVMITDVPSPFFLNRGKVPRTGVPFWPPFGEPSPRPYPQSTIDRSRPWSTKLWTGSMTIFYQK
jgi:hypothetical protein